MRRAPRQIRETLSAAIKTARVAAGLSQVELEELLAAALGVSRVATATVSRYERGDVVPPLETLDVLCDILSGRDGALIEALEEAMKPAASARKRKESP